MKKLKKPLLLLCIFLLLTLCGCQEKPVDATQKSEPTQSGATTTAPPSLEFTENVLISVAEPHGDSFGVKNGLQTTYQGITYSFMKEIYSDQREHFIYSATAILHQIRQQVGALEGQWSICVLDDLYSPWVAGNTLYIGILNVDTMDLPLGLSMLVLGRQTNYGLIYALSMEVAEELGFPTENPTRTLSSALSLYEEAPCYLDLSYPCFLEVYTDAPTIEKVKVLSRAFYNYLRWEGRLDLLTDYSDADFCTLLSAFLTENGKGPYDNSDLAGTSFFPGGSTMTLVFENDYAVYYLEKNYESKYGSGIFEEQMLATDYANLRQWACDSAAQGAYLDEQLGHFDPDPAAKVDVFLEFAQSPLSIGGYGNNTITLYSDEAFLRFYTNHVTRGAKSPWWMQRAVYEYFQYKPVDAHITYGWYGDMQNVTSPTHENDSTGQLWQAIRQQLGHPFDWTNPDDYFYQVNAFILAWDFLDTDLKNGGRGGTGMSFVHYLVSNYGQEAALSAAINGDPEVLLGKDWDTLIADWEHDLKTQFAWAEPYDR